MTDSSSVSPKIVQVQLYSDIATIAEHHVADSLICWLVTRSKGVEIWIEDFTESLISKGSN